VASSSSVVQIAARGSWQWKRHWQAGRDSYMTAFFLHSFAGQLLKIQALLKAHFLMKYQMLLRIGYISRINPTGLVAIYFQLSPSSLEDGLISRRVKFVSLWLPCKCKLFLIKSKQGHFTCHGGFVQKIWMLAFCSCSWGNSRADVVSFGYRVLKIPCVQWEKSKVLIGSFVYLSSNAQPARATPPPPQTFEAHSHC